MTLGWRWAFKQQPERAEKFKPKQGLAEVEARIPVQAWVFQTFTATA